MKRTMLTAAMLMALAAPSLAQPRYDRALEQAVMEIVAGRMDGTLRGSFAWDRKPPAVSPERSAPESPERSTR